MFLILNLFPSMQAINKDDFFIYEITNANHYLYVGDHLITQQGFGSQEYPIGTKVNATVYYITSYGVGYKFWVNDSYAFKGSFKV